MAEHPDSLRERLRLAVERIHGAPARWLYAVEVEELSDGVPVWLRAVEVFRLEGHPETDRCYAWESNKHGGEPRSHAVLSKPPIETAGAAVRSVLAAEPEAGGI